MDCTYSGGIVPGLMAGEGGILPAFNTQSAAKQRVNYTTKTKRPRHAKDISPRNGFYTWSGVYENSLSAQVSIFLQCRVCSGKDIVWGECACTKSLKTTSFVETPLPNIRDVKKCFEGNLGTNSFVNHTKKKKIQMMTIEGQGITGNYSWDGPTKRQHLG